MLKPGIYEQVINNGLRKVLAKYDDMVVKTETIEKEEAAKILSKYISDVIEISLQNILDAGGDIYEQVELINKIVKTVVKETRRNAIDEFEVDKKAQQLLAILDRKNNIYGINDKIEMVRPETSIAQSSLFTGALHEPSMYTELKKEILSCDRIDMIVSFIRWSGLRLVIDELTDFTQNGRKLRVITTSYMGATDIKAIEVLSNLMNTEVKISYDTKRTRLHAKAYIFYRNTGFTTAYVGSSNLSNAAISSGLEWNIKITAKDLPETMEKVIATFDAYWNSTEFDTYSHVQKGKLAKALKLEKKSYDKEELAYMFDIRPYSYQQEILDKLNAEREIRGFYRNLVIAATGTGKTIISAFDYKRYRDKNKGKPCRLLFVAHREEILKQSLSCFSGVLKDPNFGSLFVGSYKPDSLDHLFISIQTFNSQSLYEKTTPNFYDYIVIDEFHHAAAPTYQKLLTYYKPKILLGLTATPERMDGKNVFKYFDYRIAAEIRLPEAIERKLLCPFHYFGVTDTVDLDKLKWTRGGYDRKELSNIYTMNQVTAYHRANMIIKSIHKYITDMDEVKGLGFCVSVDHAKFMSNYFNDCKIPSIYLTGNSADEERKNAKSKLISGEIKFIFVVDIYNEGVDIPEVNTILFLRPTESLTVFLQQLGRGLRLAENKECLTVLDFIGRANKKYNFKEKFSALLNNSRKSFQREIKEGFVSVPKGCYIQLEKKAKEYILKNIRSSFGTQAGLISHMATFEEDTGKELTLENFLLHYHLDIRSVYIRNNFSRLCVLAGLKDDFNEPMETVLTNAFKRICVIDSRRWIKFLLKILPSADTIEESVLTDMEKRMLRMFHFTIWQKSVDQCGFNSLKESLLEIKNNPVLFSELIHILKYRYNQIDFIDEAVDLGFQCPLDVYCTYTRDQILVGMDYMKPSTVREGVKYLADKKIDLFFITLNKSDKDYSPTTMYKDYSINEYLFHWQSQSTTSENSPTGQRYINHKKMGSRVLLFVREYKKDIAGTAPYTFLGLAEYVKHEGSKPMNIVWRLQKPIPAKYIKKTNKVIVG